jgi:NAD(P)-dependent dehydrogenase (short-subunit alcohol dehydrogenase family)
MSAGSTAAVYCATKHAVGGIHKVHGDRMGATGHPHQRHLPPPSSCTPLTEADVPAAPSGCAWVEDKIKLGRVGEVEDIMGAALYLRVGGQRRW